MGKVFKSQPKPKYRTQPINVTEPKSKYHTMPINVDGQQKKLHPGSNKEHFEKVKGMLKASYDTKVQNVGAAKKDAKLSGKRVSVFHDSETAKTYVVHRGTASMKDWGTDLMMGLGYEGGNRFKHSEKIQRQAEKKYGKSNVTTMGHSLGGRLAEKYGKKSAQTITYNKASVPRSVIESHLKPISKKQTDMRTKLDVVSGLSKLQRSHNKTQEMSTKTYNPIKAHNLDNFKFKNLTK